MESTQLIPSMVLLVPSTERKSMVNNLYYFCLFILLKKFHTNILTMFSPFPNFSQILSILLPPYLPNSTLLY